MVWIFLPTTDPAGATHERTGWPSTRTVQAPQAATPQPNFVPVMPSTSRNTHNKGISGSASTLTALPLICSSTPPPMSSRSSSKALYRQGPRADRGRAPAARRIIAPFMALITLLNAQLAFGHVALLDHTDFSLETGERIGLIGRNGAG